MKVFAIKGHCDKARLKNLLELSLVLGMKVFAIKGRCDKARLKDLIRIGNEIVTKA
jgi:Icc-related predicted phosphoesterase